MSSVPKRQANSKQGSQRVTTAQQQQLGFLGNLKKMLEPQQMQELVNTIKKSILQNETNAKAENSTSNRRNTMANCSLRFCGQRDHQAVDEFINAVNTYINVENISEEEALKGVSLLFQDTAALWWQGIHKEAKSWSDCLRLIRENFSPQKPTWQVYMEIFSKSQDEQCCLDDFVVQKRALLAQLPAEMHNEKSQLDLIYGLLNIKFRKYIFRNEISNFKELLEKGRQIEQNFLELAIKEKQKPKRCSFCNYRGHSASECRKRQQQQEQRQLQLQKKQPAKAEQKPVSVAQKQQTTNSVQKQQPTITVQTSPKQQQQLRMPYDLLDPYDILLNGEHD